MILKSFFVYLPAVLAGFGFVHLFWKRADTVALSLKVFLGIGIGLGLTSCLYFLRLLILPGQSGYLLIEFIFLIGVFTAILVKRGFLPQWPNRIPIVSLLVVLLVAAVALYYLMIYARLSPYGDYDAQAIWNMRARFIYRLGDNWRGAFSPLINRDFHMDYPLLIPLSVVGGWNTLGSEVLRVPSIISILFLLGMAGVLYGVIASLRTTSQAAMAGTILLATPGLLLFSTFQTADIPLAYFFLASATLLILAEKENSRGLLFLAGMMAGLSAWTKNEGVPFVIIVLIYAILFFGRRRSSNDFSALLFGAALPLSTLVLFKIVISLNNDLFTDNGASAILSKLIEPDRYIQILSHLTSEIFHLGNWPFSIVIVLLVYAGIMGLRKPYSFSESAMWIVPLSQFIVYMLIYLITPHDLEWHLNYSLSRLLIHLFPMVLCFFFLWVNPPESVLNKVK